MCESGHLIWQSIRIHGLISLFQYRSLNIKEWFFSKLWIFLIDWNLYLQLLIGSIFRNYITTVGIHSIMWWTVNLNLSNFSSLSWDRGHCTSFKYCTIINLHFKNSIVNQNVPKNQITDQWLLGSLNVILQSVICKLWQ